MATMPPQIAALISTMCINPIRVNAVATEVNLAERLTQSAYSIEQQRKTDLLLELLDDNAIYSAIAFTRTKARANRLVAALSKRSVTVERIHGDRSQAQRTRALEQIST